MELVFATNNAHKVQECRLAIETLYATSVVALPLPIKILTLKEVNITEEIPETQPTIEANAIQKAEYIYHKYGFNCFADDTGLEIDALNGEPGVYSARYSGEERSYEKNNTLVLEKLKTENNRNAQFKTIIALIIRGKLTIFEGIVKGEILESLRGTNGFGYDPLFLPHGSKKTLAEMTDEEKNNISHRGIATRHLAAYLKWLMVK